MAIPRIGLGSRGDDVRAIQNDLRKAGISTPDAESNEQVFGVGTRKSLSLFQAAVGLSSTGVMDARTRAALDDALRVIAFDKPRIEGRLVTEHGVPAANVRVRLRNPPAQGGNVFAEGVVPLVPRRGAAVGILPVTAEWHEWVGQWEMEVEAPRCAVLPFKMSK